MTENHSLSTSGDANVTSGASPFEGQLIYDGGYDIDNKLVVMDNIWKSAKSDSE